MVRSAGQNRFKKWAALISGGRAFFSWSLLLGAFLSFAMAQLPTGTISGVIRDASGGVLPGVTIALTNVETGQSRTVLTDDSGNYKAVALAVGRYELKAEMTGFKTVVRHIGLAVGQEAVVDFELPVGEVSEEVQVTGEAPLVNTTSSSLGGLVSDQKVADLPLNGRNFIDLAFLQPAIQQHRNITLQSGLTGGYFSSNGAGVRSNNILLDGANMVNLWGVNSSSVTGSTLGVEGIREFRVVTNAFSAEYGMNMGSQISIVSKSGTNHFHGSLFEYLRNSVLDARNFFDRKTATNTKRLPTFIRNNFGAAVGGPIKKDQTFFHVAYEGLRESLGLSIVSNTIPPTARVDGAVVPVINPFVKKLLSLFPQPNLPNNQFTFPFTQPTTEDYFQGRVDHSFSSNDNIFFRYTVHDAEISKAHSYPQFRTEQESRSQFATLSETHVFSPALLNTFRFSYSRTNIRGDSGSGIQGPDFSLIPGRELGNLIIPGVTSGPFGLGPDPVMPTVAKQNVFTLSNDAFYTVGRHSLRVGTLINHYQQYAENNLVAKGFVVFPNLPGFLVGQTANYIADGIGSNQTRTNHYNTFGFYLQDDWKALSNLTFNLGLRYEFITVPVEQQGRGVSLRNLKTDAAFTPGKQFRNPSLKNWSPRLGFAWDPAGNGRTAIRGGFGLVYDVGSFGSAVVLVSTSQPPYSFRNQEVGQILTVPLSFPSGSVGKSVRTMDFNIQQPHLLQYNLSLEQALPFDMAASIAYAGSRGINLMQVTDGNPTVPQIVNGKKFWTGREPRINPNWLEVFLATAGGNSWYNSMQVSLQKRLSNGLQFQSSYTWSKLIDETQAQLLREESNSLTFPTDVFNRQTDRGLASFDLRHNWRFNTIYRFPRPSMSGALGQLLKGWWISSIATVSSGYPFTPAIAINRSRSAVLGPTQNGLDRPNVAGNRSMDEVVLGGPDRYFDPNAFVLQDAGFLGNSGRNTVIGPGFATVDLSVAKDTNLPFLGEEGKLEFRAEFFNILNRANFALPDRIVFGGAPTPLPTAGQILSTVSTSRQVQFALKLIF
ncbi:MAG: TonB-dependent receptor [Acidobacteria bacterium]|nr:TonB-dependent receptor [Acidobacteriota bacterium]